jgi:hypothetical protein
MPNIDGDISEKMTNFLGDDRSFQVDVFKQDKELASSQFVRVFGRFW